MKVHLKMRSVCYKSRWQVVGLACSGAGHGFAPGVTHVDRSGSLSWKISRLTRHDCCHLWVVKWNSFICWQPTRIIWTYGLWSPLYVHTCVMFFLFNTHYLYDSVFIFSLSYSPCRFPRGPTSYAVFPLPLSLSPPATLARLSSASQF